MKNATVRVLGIGVSGASELVRKRLASEWIVDASDDGARRSGEAPSARPSAEAEVEADRIARLSGAAMRWTLRTAAIDLGSLKPERVGIVLGFRDAGLAGMVGFADEVRQQTPRFVSPLHFPNTVGNYPAGALARAMGTRGPNNTIASGSSSGVSAIVEACRHLQFDEADVMFAGSVECSALFSRELEADTDIACWFLLSRAGAEVGGGRGVVDLASWSSGGLAIAPGAAREVEPASGAAGALALAAAISQLRAHQIPPANSRSPTTTSIADMGCADTGRASGERARVRFEDRARRTFTEFVIAMPDN